MADLNGRSVANAKKVAKGQTVFLIRRFSRPPELREDTVTSVGRKFGYLSSGNRFFLDTMAVEHGPGFVYLSRESFEESQAINALWSRASNLPRNAPPAVSAADIKAALRLLGQEVPE